MKNINLNNLPELKVKSSNSSAQSISCNGLKKTVKSLKKLIVIAFLFIKNNFQAFNEKLA